MNNVYLMWVGSESYSTIADYVSEANEQGISKRLPNAHIARALAEPDTVVFVAHDEGESEPCPDCVGPIENPLWRVESNKLARITRDVEARTALLNDAKAHAERGGAGDEEAKELDRAEKILARSTTKLDAQTKVVADTPPIIEATTGGHVTVDGEVWDYRRYNYWYKQPKKFDADSHDVRDHEKCETCGTSGRLPLGKVFGVFIPAAIEYILKPEDDDAVKAEMEGKGFRVLPATTVGSEKKRGCGYRKHGGYYAVTDESETAKRAASASAEDVVKKLVEAGKVDPDGVTINGDFIQFVAPVDIPGTKRFRGIKSWSLDSDVEDEAEMILEAV